MKYIKKLLERILSRFSIIVTCICIAVPTFDVIIEGELTNIDMMLFEIVAVSLLCSLGELLILKINFLQKRYIFLSFIYYIYVNLCVIGFGCIVGWFDYKNPPELIVIAIIILLIFIVNFLVTYIHDKNLSNKINSRLEEMRAENNNPKR